MPTPPDPTARTPEQQFERFRQHADAGALAAVFDAVAPELLLVAAHLAPQATDAEDLVQATFVDAIEQRARWDGARPLVPWLIGILANHARQARRKAAQAPDPTRLGAVSAGGAAPSALDEAAAREVGERIAAAVQGLPRQYRQVLTLRLVHGLSPTAIAHALGCPVATAKTRLQRGMEWLRKALPAGIAASAVLSATAGRGLAAVRAAVLTRAADLAPLAAAGATATAAATLTFGGLAMKKTLLAAVAALLVLSGWLALDPPGGAVGTPVGTAGMPARAADAAAPAPPSTEVAGAAPARAEPARTAADPDVGATLGGVDLQFVWRGTDRPAAHLRVWAKSPGRTDARWQADAEGRLHRAGLPPGDWFLSGRTLWHRLAVTAGAVTTARVEVEPGVRFDGVVVDATGRGVDGALVFAQYFPDPADATPRLVARAGPDGTFAAVSDWGGSVWAESPGFAPSAVVEIADDDNGREPVRLALEPPVAIVRGIVSATTGPGAGAELIAVRTQPPHALAAPVTTHADDGGRFALPALGAGDWLLVARLDGHADTPVAFAVRAGDDLHLDVRLQQGATITGKVTGRGGAGLRGVVEVRPAWAGGLEFTNAARPIHHRAALRAALAEDGSFRFVHVPTGRVRVEVRAGDEPLQRHRDLEVGDGATAHCAFELLPAAALAGVAVDRDGAPLRGWLVLASPEGGGFQRSATTGDDGAFELPGMDAAAYSILLQPEGNPPGMPWLRRDGVRPDAPLRLQLDCGRDAAASVRGRVLDDLGAAAAEATLVLFARGPTAGGTASGGTATGGSRPLDLDRDGEFAAGALPPGDYRALIRLGTGAGIDLGPLRLDAGAAVDLGTVRLPARGTLELTLRLPDGRPAAPLELRALDRAGNRSAFTAGADGVWRSAPLPAGTYRVLGWGRDFARFDRELAVVPARTSASTLVVDPATPVEFALELDGAGAAQPPVELLVFDAAGGRVAREQVPTDAAGRGSWTRGLSPGDYRWQARALRDGAVRDGSFAVPAAGAAPVRVAVTLPR